MNGQKIAIAFWTIAKKEVSRIFRIWTQTLLPSVVTSVLYFVIFGAFIGSRIGYIEGTITYMQFIVPGLVMMAVITNAFQNVVGSFFIAKFQRNIEEILVSPTPNWVIIAGYVAGGVTRGVLVGLLVLLISLVFTSLTVYYVGAILIFILLTSILFSLAGLCNAIYGKNFDQIAIVPTFVLVPLTYLGGVFYSIKVLPEFWQMVSKLNPILYMVNGFRYGFLGISDVSPTTSFVVLFMSCLAFLYVDWRLINKGVGLKN